MSEKTLQEGLQTLIVAMSDFVSGDVTINDWDIMDGEAVNAPFVIIGNANEFSARQDTQTANTKWNIEVFLIVEFNNALGWATSLNNFRDKRQNLINTMNTGDDRSANGQSAVTIDLIRPGEPIQYWYDPSTPPDALASTSPLYVYQMLIFEVEEY